MKIIYSKKELRKVAELNVKVIDFLREYVDSKISSYAHISVEDMMNKIEEDSIDFGFFKEYYNKETEEYIVEIDPEFINKFVDLGMEIVDEVSDYVNKNKFQVLLSIGSAKFFLSKYLFPRMKQIFSQHMEFLQNLLDKFNKKLEEIYEGMAK